MFDNAQMFQIRKRLTGSHKVELEHIIEFIEEEAVMSMFSTSAHFLRRDLQDFMERGDEHEVEQIRDLIKRIITDHIQKEL